MIPIDEQNHYEVLEISRGVSPEEIERAYWVARSCYADDSLALYSVFDLSDAAVIRERIDLAYRVLTDMEARRVYDAKLAAEELESVDPVDVRRSQSAAKTPDVQTVAFDEFDAEEQSGEFDGARLRRERVRRGFELEQVAGITKINPSYLRAVEDERYEELPPPVYVRGFVAAYACAVGLDPAKVVGSYMAGMSRTRGE
ncbi:MAG: helix-turn-helix domain-containing protein [Myxococcota bacterium]